MIEERVSFLGKVMAYPGEDEMSALAEGGLRVLKGEEEALIYWFAYKIPYRNFKIYTIEWGTIIEYNYYLFLILFTRKRV